MSAIERQLCTALQREPLGNGFSARTARPPQPPALFLKLRTPYSAPHCLAKSGKPCFPTPQESTPSSFLIERLHSLPHRKDPGNLRGHLFGTQCSRAWHTLSPMILEAMVPLARNVRKLSPTPHSSNKSELPERSMLAWARPHERQVGPC